MSSSPPSKTTTTTKPNNYGSIKAHDPQDQEITDIDHFDPDQERYIGDKDKGPFWSRFLVDFVTPILVGIVILAAVVFLVWKASEHFHYSNKHVDTTTKTNYDSYDDDDHYVSHNSRNKRAPLGPQGKDIDNLYIPGPPHAYSHDDNDKPHRYLRLVPPVIVPGD
jgi:hypothetical protein